MPGSLTGSITGDDGLAAVMRRLDEVEKRLAAAAASACEEIADLLEAYAKAHHGTTPREAGWVYPGGGRWRSVGNLYEAGTGRIGRGKVWQATRRWRESGVGWGDVTAQTQQTIAAGWRWVAADVLRVVLSANTPQAVMLELARSGKWAWLWPAIEDNADRIRAIVRKHITL
jgi:hypothetical protein